MQLEKIIGKLKTEKYGGRILEEIASYESDPQKNNADGSKETKGNTVKKLKTKKTLVVLESSEDETWISASFLEIWSY